MLTDEQIRQFREDGYLVFAALIQGERLAITSRCLMN